MARIFISHSSRNNAEALALRDWLISQGWNDLFLDIHPTDGLVAAERWQAALRKSIGRCRAVIFCLSPEWLGSPHCISEFNEAMHVGAAPLGVIVRSVSLEQLPGEMSKHWQIVDLTMGGTRQNFIVAPPPERSPVQVHFPLEELRRLRAGLAKLGLVGFDTESFPWPPPEDPSRPPYAGLAALDTIDAGIFFGRDNDLIRAREDLLTLREKGGGQLFAILGASGAGKSSFLRAGLLPRLQREDRDFLVLPPIRPRSAPLSGSEGLAEGLMQAFEKLRAPRALGDLKAILREGENALPPLLAELQERASVTLVGEGRAQVDRPPTIVLAVDQAEELFADESNRETATFLRVLASALKQGPEMIALATVRVDGYAQLQRVARNLSVPVIHPFDLAPVAPFAFREAITGPARRADPPIQVEPQLVDRLLLDMADQGADPLPLLALTLQRLYRDFGRSERSLRLAHYERLGGLDGSIEAALAEAFAEPERSPAIPADPNERERLLETVFIPALADINEKTNEPTRRIAAASELPGEGRGLVSRLVGARLLVEGTRTAGETTEQTVEVAHEALLRQWKGLRRLLDLRSSDLKELAAVERAAQAWWNARPSQRWRTNRFYDFLDSPSATREALAPVGQENLHQLFRATEWLDHKGARLEAAERIVGGPEFAKRLDSKTRSYLTNCRRAENIARTKSKGEWWPDRHHSVAAQVSTYTLMAIAFIVLLLANA
jgi:hypothetical protein